MITIKEVAVIGNFKFLKHSKRLRLITSIDLFCHNKKNHGKKKEPGVG